MKADRALILVTLFVIATVTLWQIDRLQDREEHFISTGQKLTTLSLRRLEPASNSEGVICAGPGHFVQCVYQIHNGGRAVLENLSLGHRCNCHGIESFPRELLPGQTAKFTFRVQALDAGILKQRIPILSSGRVMATLDITIETMVPLPFLETKLIERAVTFVKGDASSRALLVRTVERRTATPWITGIRMLSEDILRIENLRLQEKPHPDAELMRRTYLFELSATDIPVGNYVVPFQLQASEMGDLKYGEGILNVQVLDSIAILPTKLEFALNDSRPVTKLFVELGRSKWSLRNLTHL